MNDHTPTGYTFHTFGLARRDRGQGQGGAISELNTARAATVRQRTLDEQARTVDAVLVTENRATVLDLRTFRAIDEVLLMGGAELPEQVPLLESHIEGSTEAIRGSVVGMERNGRSIEGTLRFSNIESAAEAWTLVREGHLNAVSVGTASIEFDEIPPGQTARIGGTQYTASPERPLRITRRWAIREVSLVTIGADDEARIRSRLGRTGDRTMNERLRNYLVSLGMAPDATDADAYAFLGTLSGARRERAHALLSGTNRQEPGAENGNGNGGDGDGDGDGDDDADDADDTTDDAGNGGEGEAGDGGTEGTAAAAIAADAVRRERDRVSAIRRHGSGGVVPPELVNRAVDENWSAEQAAGVFLEHSRAARSAVAGVAPNANTRRTQRSELALAVRSGVLQRAGLDPTEGLRLDNVPQAHRAQIVERAANDGIAYSDMSLVEIARLSLQIANVPVPAGRDNVVRAAVSTGEFANIFLDSVNMTVEREFEEQPDTTRGWTMETDVADFKTNRDITPKKSDGLKLLARGGKAEHAHLGDKAELYRVHRFAEQAIMDEQDIIDDSLNVLLDTAQALADDAAAVRPDLVYAILLSNPDMNQDGTALFDPTHNNLFTTGTELSGTTFQTGLSNMRKQTLENGRALNIMARWTLVPPDLEWLIRQILTSGERRGSGANEESGTINPVRGITNDPVVESRLGVQGVTDPITGTHYPGTATNWFLAAARRTIKVAYLRGTNRRPTVRSFTLSQGQWGVGYDIKLDIGAGAIDFRGLQKNTGEA